MDAVLYLALDDDRLARVRIRDERTVVGHAADLQANPAPGLVVDDDLVRRTSALADDGEARDRHADAGVDPQPGELRLDPEDVLRDRREVPRGGSGEPRV